MPQRVQAEGLDEGVLRLAGARLGPFLCSCAVLCHNAPQDRPDTADVAPA